MSSGPLSPTSDLDVLPLSSALAGWTVDVVVSGSIGAVESVRFVRALRRLGAEVVPWLTTGGAQFITETALSWAAGAPVRQAFTGDASHIAEARAVIVAPASASLIGRVANGLTDTPAAALIASHLGRRRPVLMLPNMHDSLLLAPPVAANVERLASFGVQVLGARLEEGKRKFPDPATLADECAHLLRRRDGAPGLSPVLITLGTTRGYVDPVRYFSNYSSGRLGSAIAEELYRLGHPVHAVCGPAPIMPRVATTLTRVETNDQMEAAAQAALRDGASAAILAASVLDFAPKTTASGKIPSHGGDLTIELAPTRKIIAAIQPASGVKVGFKLETGLTPERAAALATRYIGDLGLSLFVANDLADVDAARHRALVFEPSLPGAVHELPPPRMLEGKEAVAAAVAAHVHAALYRYAVTTSAPRREAP